jgi:hypothetical protein
VARPRSCCVSKLQTQTRALVREGAPRRSSHILDNYYNFIMRSWWVPNAKTGRLTVGREIISSSTLVCPLIDVFSF